MNKIKLIIILFFIISLVSCNLFSTRDPEAPDTGKSSFQPPTDAIIVITNFISSIKEKNTQNYISCLTDSSTSGNKQFEFSPSSDAMAYYSSIFKNWNLEDEKYYFRNMATKLENTTPELILTNNNYKFESQNSDSAIYITDYILTVNHNLPTISKKFAGTMQFTIVKLTSGQWAIQRWIDSKNSNDSIQSTWSMLKAQFRIN